LLPQGGGDIGIENHRRIPEFMSMALARAAVRRQGLKPPYQTMRAWIDSGVLRTRVPVVIKEKWEGVEEMVESKIVL
jgi:hypothetical protein